MVIAMERQKEEERETTHCVQITELYSRGLKGGKADMYKEMSPVLLTLSVFGINFHKRFILFCHQFNRCEIAWTIYSMVILLW